MAGPTEQTYTLVADDVGANISVEVTATNGQGSVTVESAAIGPILGAAPDNTATPTLSDATPEVGDTLTVTTGTWTGLPTITYDYEWRRDGSVSAANTGSASYSVTSDDLGTVLTCAVTATNAHGSALVVSNASSTVLSVSNTPTLDTAAHLWIAKNHAVYYDSGSDGLVDQAGAAVLQLGAASAGDAGDPTFGNDGTHEYLLFDGTDDILKTTSNVDLSSVFTIVAVILLTASGGDRRLIGGQTGGSPQFAVYMAGAGTSLTLFTSNGSSPGAVTHPTGSKVTSAFVNGSGAGARFLRANGASGTTGTGAGYASKVVTFGARNGPSNVMVGRYFGSAVFLSALNASQIDAAGTEILSLAEL